MPNTLRMLPILLSVFFLWTSATATGQAQPRDRQARVQKAKQLFMEGARAYQDGKLQLALKKLLEAQRTWKSPELAFNIARVHERMGNAEEGIRWFRAFLTHGKPDGTVRADVQKRITALQALYERQRGQIFQAPPSDDEMTEESRRFFKRGVVMFSRGQYEAAMQAFNAAMHFAPFPELLYNMAVTAERTGEYRDAADYYREYLRLKKNAPDREQVLRTIKNLKRKKK